MSGSLATNLDSNGNGLTALDYRHILQSLYPTPGIVNGGTVTGNSSLTYHVAPTVAVIDRGSDGTRLAYYAGGDTPAVAAGDASNRRIDVIWLKANDPALDGGSKEVIVGVTQGNPAANPTVPTLESGQLALMEKLVQPGTTNLSTGSGDNRSYNYAIPYGGSLGRLGELGMNTQTIAQEWQSKWYNQVSVNVPALYTDRLVQVDFMARASGPSSGSSYYVKLIVDGADQSDGMDELPVFDTWVRNRISYRTVLTAGMPHQVAIAIMPNLGKEQFTWRGLRSVEVSDIGVAK